TPHHPQPDALVRILIAHNTYQQPGGEDAVFAAEVALLRAHGHEVTEYLEDNDRVGEYSKPALALNTIWSRQSRRRIAALVRDRRIEVAHFHNTFPLMSPAVFAACKQAGVPVVQTLHNYRIFCANSACFRDGRPCEDCLDRTPPWPGVRHACYRHSR